MRGAERRSCSRPRVRAAYAEAMDTDFQADHDCGPGLGCAGACSSRRMIFRPSRLRRPSTRRRTKRGSGDADGSSTPTAIPVGMTSDNFAEFEVLITEGGGVESVKALRVPATMADAVSMTMRLSAAKAWRFHPALKDGEPVRYRRIVWVLKS